MTAPPPSNPAIGKSIDANGIRTNYLQSGSGEQTVVLVHGSGPGVTAYANWRLVLPTLGEDFTCYAPDMVGFGYSDRPEDVEYGVQTWADQTVGFIKAMGIEKTHLIGNSFGGSIALRIATEHPELIDNIVLMGSMGVPFDITDGLDTVWGYEGTIEIDAQGARLLRLLARPGQRGTGSGAIQGQHGTRLPRILLVHVPGATAALGRRHVAPRRGDPGAAQPHPDRARPGGQGHPARDLAQAGATHRQRRPVGILALWALVDDRAHRRLQPSGARLLPAGSRPSRSSPSRTSKPRWPPRPRKHRSTVVGRSGVPRPGLLLRIYRPWC